MLGGHLVITVWFPYRRWFLLVILNLSSTIAVRAVLTIISQPRPLQRGQTFIANALQVEHGDRVLPSVMAGRVASTRSFWIKSSPNDARDAIYIHGLDVAPFLGRLGLSGLW